MSIETVALFEDLVNSLIQSIDGLRKEIKELKSDLAAQGKGTPKGKRSA